MPGLIASATSKGVRLWADKEGTMPFDEPARTARASSSGRPGSVYAAIGEAHSPAEYIAEVQRSRSGRPTSGSRWSPGRWGSSSSTKKKESV